MPTLLIDIQDVTTQPIKGDTVTLTAPAPRPATGGGVTRPFSRLVNLVDGKGSTEVDPGPLRVMFHDGYGREVVIDTRVPDEGDVFTLRELIVSEIGDVDDVPGIREALDGKADKEHTHPATDILGLSATLDSLGEEIAGKAPAEHSHEIADVDGLQAELDDKAEKYHQHQTSDIEGLNRTLESLRTDIGSAASAKHTHAIGDVTGLQGALDGKANKAHNHNIGEIKDLIWSLDQKVSISDLAESTRQYASEKIAELVDGAPESLDTLREVAEEFKNQDRAIQAVFSELGKRAMKSHTHAIGDVTGLQGALDGKVNVSDVTDSLSAVSYGKVVKREDGGLAIRAGEPEQAYHAATKRYVDGEVAKKADKSALENLTVLTGASGDGWIASRRGSVVTLRIDRLQTGPSADLLPASMRPTIQTFIPVSDLGGNPSARAAVNPGGTVTGSDIASIAFGVATYVV